MTTVSYTHLAGGAGRVHLESLSTPVPGGPVLRISTSGPAGVIRIRHAGARRHRFTRWRRWGCLLYTSRCV